MNDQTRLRFLHYISTTLLVLLLGLTANVFAAPPEPSPIDIETDDTLDISIDNLDLETLLFTENYAEFIAELEDALKDFDEYLEEYGLYALDETENALKNIHESLIEEYSSQITEDVLEELESALHEIESVSHGLKEEKEKTSHLKRNQLRKLQREIEDIRDQLEDLVNDVDDNPNYDNAEIAELIKRRLRETERAISQAEHKIRVTQEAKKNAVRTPRIVVYNPPEPPDPPEVPSMEGVVKPSAPMNEEAKSKYKAAQDLYKQYVVRHAMQFNAEEMKLASAGIANTDAIINVINNIGSVQVSTWNKSEIQAELTINYAADMDKSRELAREITLQVISEEDAGTSGNLTVRVVYPEKNEKTVNIIGTELDIRVPASNQLKITNAFGPIDVIGIRNSVQVNSNFSQISLEQIKGDVKITNASGNIYLENIKGRIEANNSFGSIEAILLNGDAFLTNSYAPIEVMKSSGRLKIFNSGNIVINRHRGDAEVESSNGNMELFDITGQLTASNSFGEIIVENVGGNASIENANGRMQLSEIKGRLEASNKFGPIIIEDASQDVSVSATNGPIEIERVVGNVEIANRFGPVNLESIGGSVRVKNSNSPVEISDVGKDVIVSNQFSPITLMAISGDVDAENINSSVELVDIGGESKVSTSNGLISCSNIKGTFSIINNFGSIEMIDIGTLDDDCKVTTTNGDILIELSSTAKFNLSLSTSNGVVGTDFPTLINTSGSKTFGEIDAGASAPTLVLRGENTSIQLLAH